MRVYSNIEAIKRRTLNQRRENAWLGGALMLILLSLALLFFTAERVLFGKLQYEVRRLESARRDLQQVNRRLLLELASLESPERLAREGRKLGLRAPRKEQLVFIEVR